MAHGPWPIAYYLLPKSSEIFYRNFGLILTIFIYNLSYLKKTRQEIEAMLGLSE